MRGIGDNRTKTTAADGSFFYYYYYLLFLGATSWRCQAPNLNNIFFWALFKINIFHIFLFFGHARPTLDAAADVLRVRYVITKMDLSFSDHIEDSPGVKTIPNGMMFSVTRGGLAMGVPCLTDRTTRNE